MRKDIEVEHNGDGGGRECEGKNQVLRAYDEIEI
jgi:hypothetical protein